MPFKQVRVGMKPRDTTRWVILDVTAASLRALFEAGKNQATRVGRAGWLALMPGATTQENCNAEGINIVASYQAEVELRVGLVMNNEADCKSSDSNIGLGLAEQTGISCGAFANGSSGTSAPLSAIPAFCYLMVR